VAVVSLSTLRSIVRDKADMETGGPVTDSQVDERINAAIKIVHGLLCQYRGDEYFEKDYSLTTSNTVAEYALPADFLRISQGGVWWITGQGQNLPIRKYPANESMIQLVNQGWYYQPYVRTTPVRYRVRYGGSVGVTNIRFVPTPNTAQSVMVKYIPRPVVLSAPADTWDGYGGMEEAVKWHAAASCKAKQESDPSYELGMFQREIQTLIETVDRDNAEPPQVAWVDGFPYTVDDV
jgi:hypothetical protein